MSINGYNIAAELIDFIIAVVVLYLAVASKPRQTAVYSIVLSGLINSVVNIVLHVCMVWFASNPAYVVNPWFKAIVAGYYVTYLCILILLFSYVHLLTLKQRENLKGLNTCNVIFMSTYMIVVGFVYITNQYYIVDGSYSSLTNLSNINIAFGLCDVILVIASAFANRDGMPKIMLVYICLFMPFEPALLLLQMYRPYDMILSITYVLPFMLCYIMFHSVPFDEVTGCQNRQAFESHYLTLKKRKKNFIVIYVKFPRLDNAYHEGTHNVMMRMVSAYCRKLERFSAGARVYTLSDNSFGVIIKSKRENHLRKCILFVRDGLEKAMINWTYSHMPEFRMVVCRDSQLLSDMSDVRYLENYLFSKLERGKTNFYEAIDEDYEVAMEFQNIENVIIDIRNKGNLNDERVICYLQPIYHVDGKSFKNAEALMRLMVDGRMISPTIFIPLAERNGCLHVLTRIILNKVCRKVYEIQDYYTFDAISVNVSLTEFMDFCLHNELIDIIERNGISPSKIRLEMTETMTAEEMDAICYNMEEFTKAGVSFYLDDFGTGYSNLEKIISLPFKTIKFDKCLLYKSEDDLILRQLVENMVEVFKKHGLIVLVEGVETDEQAKLSEDVGFDYIQGFNYAKPVPIDEIEQYFSKKKKRVG